MKCTGNAAAGRGSYGYPPLGMRVLMRLLISRKQQWGEWLHKWVDVVVDILMMDISKKIPKSPIHLRQHPINEKSCASFGYLSSSLAN